MNINNTGWVSYAENTFTDGIHTIQYRVTDNAGNVTETAIQEIKVDTITPVINISTTGTLGSNNWYVSNVAINATSSDTTSGIVNFEMNLNDMGWTTFDLQPVTLTDGIHSVQYRATDNASNTYTTTTQEIKVDTTTPNLSLATTGTKGQNDWYVTQTSVTPTSTDSGSGIASIEYKINNGIFNLYISPLQFTDGINSYQFQLTDQAGNITITPPISLKVDTIAPAIDMDTEINLGDTLYYDLEDSGSGLWINRTVIEDEDEKYKKVVWLDEISGNKVKSEILWDGKFADKTSAPVGEYFITLKISDYAGNETFQTAIVNVNPLSFLQIIPSFVPPVSDEITSNSLPSNEQNNFGNESNNTIANETTSSNSGGEVISADAIAQAGTQPSNSFSFGNESTSTPIATSNILWGAVAAAAVGMTLAEWQKRREEEEKQRQSERPNTAGRKKYEEKMRMKRIIGESQALMNQRKQEKEKQNAVSSARWNGIAKIELAKQKAKQIAVSAARWAGIAKLEQEKQKANVGGSKGLASPVPQDPNPPDKYNDGVSTWWDIFDGDWWKSNEPWPAPFGPKWESPKPVATQTTAIQTAWAHITQTVQAIPTSTLIPTHTSTPPAPNYQIYKSTGPLTPWEATVGGQVAHNAHLLLAQANDFYFWSNDDPGTNSNPPKPLNYDYVNKPPISLNPNDYNYNAPWGNVLQYTGGRIPFVCGDVPDHAYLNAGYDLQQIIPLTEYQNHWPSSSYGYMTMLSNQGNLNIYTVGNNPNFGTVPELGDVIITQTSNDWGNPHGAGHVVVVGEVHGNTPSQIIIIDGNATQGTLEQYTVQELIDRNPDLQYLLYGHPDLPTGTP